MRHAYHLRLLPIALGALMASCATPPATPPTAPSQADIDQARSIATRVPASLLTVLTAELANGPAAAIEACRVKAPELAKSASAQTGWQIHRAGLRPRSPNGIPDAWERVTLEQFDAKRAAGAEPATLERYEVVTEDGRHFVRYGKALPTQALCTQCHGTPDQLGPGVAARLAVLYPGDRAVGYTAGQIRGGLFMKKPLP